MTLAVMDASSLPLLTIVTASLAATGYIWTRIAQLRAPAFAKLFLAAIVLTPLLGPLFWLFLFARLPTPRVPESALPFRGPVAPTPTNPRWLVVAWHSLAVAGAVIIVALNAYVFVTIAR